MIRSDTRLSQEIVPIDENYVSLCPNGDPTASVAVKRPAGAGAPDPTVPANRHLEASVCARHGSLPRLAPQIHHSAAARGA
jgi:hypothetical protein